MEMAIAIDMIERTRAAVLAVWAMCTLAIDAMHLLMLHGVRDVVLVA